MVVLISNEKPKKPPIYSIAFSTIKIKPITAKMSPSFSIVYNSNKFSKDYLFLNNIWFWSIEEDLFFDEN